MHLFWTAFTFCCSNLVCPLSAIQPSSILYSLNGKWCALTVERRLKLLPRIAYPNDVILINVVKRTVYVFTMHIRFSHSLNLIFIFLFVKHIIPFFSGK